MGSMLPAVSTVGVVRTQHDHRKLLVILIVVKTERAAV